MLNYLDDELPNDRLLDHIAYDFCISKAYIRSLALSESIPFPFSILSIIFPPELVAYVLIAMPFS